MTDIIVKKYPAALRVGASYIEAFFPTGRAHTLLYGIGSQINLDINKVILRTFTDGLNKSQVGHILLMLFGNVLKGDNSRNRFILLKDRGKFEMKPTAFSFRRSGMDMGLTQRLTPMDICKHLLHWLNTFRKKGRIIVYSFCYIGLTKQMRENVGFGIVSCPGTKLMAGNIIIVESTVGMLSSNLEYLLIFFQPLFRINPFFFRNFIFIGIYQILPESFFILLLLINASSYYNEQNIIIIGIGLTDSSGFRPMPDLIFSNPTIG